MDNKTEYVEKLSAQMVAWDAQLDMLKYKAECATLDEKFVYSDAIASLQLKRDEAAAKLQGISSANDDEWEELKEGTEKVWEEISTILHDAIMGIK